jgi:hypothetical protein
VSINFREIVTNSVDHVLIEPLKLSSSLFRRDIEGQLLGPVEEELHASKARLFGFKHEAPTGFDNGFRAIGCWGNIVGYLRRDFVRSNSIASWPCLDNFDVIGGGCIDSGHSVKD